MNIGVIGAGAASAAATHVLDTALPEAEITILEKSGGVCGRAATRRREDITYDYGANYVKDGDERVVDLLTETLSTDGLVSFEEPIYVFDDGGAVSEGRENDHQKWTYRTGLTQIAKRLFDATDATVHRRTRVEKIRRDDGWRLVDDAGETWGPFDALLCSPPAPQTATLLREADWSDPLRDSLVEAIGGVEYRTIWTAVLGYDDPLSVPYYALVNPGKDHEVGWIAREECKPGHVPDGESVLVVQANHDWSVDNLEDPPGEIVDSLADLTADVIGDQWLADPAWTDHQRWRYAIPEGGVASGPVDSARDHGLYLLGDWVAGEGRLHAALRNGLDTGEQVVYDS
jgi:renalase